MNYNLKITAKIWDKETNSLFDYETSDHISSQISISKDSLISKLNNKLFSMRDFSNLPKFKHDEFEYIASIHSDKDLYDLNFSNEERSHRLKNKLIPRSLEEKPWLIVRYTYHESENGYKLHEGDLLKFGKILFKVREIKILSENSKYSVDKLGLKDKTNGNVPQADVSQNLEGGTINIYHRAMSNTHFQKRQGDTLSQYSNEEERAGNLIMKTVKKKTNVPICRICLGDDYDQENPLITPCKCAGTMKYIHLSCLRLCFKSKIQTKVFNFLIAHCYKTFECDLCKKIIPEKIKVNNKLYSLIELQRPDNNFIILESVSKEKNENKFLYIVHMKDRNSVKLGRASEADVRITDISVSRTHAELKLIKGSFYINDMSSKFGTLVQIKNNMVVLPYSQIGIQLRKNFLLLKMTKKICSLLTCYYPKNTLFHNYNDYFDRYNNDTDDEIQEVNLTESVCKYDSANETDNTNNMAKRPSALEIRQNYGSDEKRNSERINERNFVERINFDRNFNDIGMGIGVNSATLHEELNQSQSQYNTINVGNNNPNITNNLINETNAHNYGIISLNNMNINNANMNTISVRGTNLNYNTINIGNNNGNNINSNNTNNLNAGNIANGSSNNANININSNFNSNNANVITINNPSNFTSNNINNNLVNNANGMVINNQGILPSNIPPNISPFSNSANANMSPTNNPSIRVNININVGDVNAANIMPSAINKSPNSIDLNLKVKDVKNLVDNIFQIQGIKENNSSGLSIGLNNSNLGIGNFPVASPKFKKGTENYINYTNNSNCSVDKIIENTGRPDSNSVEKEKYMNVNSRFDKLERKGDKEEGNYIRIIDNNFDSANVEINIKSVGNDEKIPLNQFDKEEEKH